MSNDRMERLATLRRVIEAQDAEWRSAQEALRRLGDIEIAVPKEFFEVMDRLFTAETNVSGVRGVRG